MSEAEIENEFNTKKIDMNAENELYLLELKHTKEAEVKKFNRLKNSSEK